MSGTLSVTVNRVSHTVPSTIETVPEFFDAIGWSDPHGYNLYLIDGDDEIGPLGELLVFDDGDEFVAIPEYLDHA